jgi:pyrimidine deaminase RibD-like protein
MKQIGSMRSPVTTTINLHGNWRVEPILVDKAPEVLADGTTAKNGRDHCRLKHNRLNAGIRED